MTVGIYALYWESTSSVYVGQSQNISSRYKEHLRKLKNSTHTNYKVQKQYDQYGTPTLVCLEICSIIELDIREVLWTAEFNSIEVGLNLIEAGGAGYGVNCASSKYTSLQILKVFRMLSSGVYYTKDQIERYTGVKEAAYASIRCGRAHLWLRDKYPFRYNLMIIRMPIWVKEGLSLASKLTRVGTEVALPVVIDPAGKEYQVSNIRQFAIDNNLNNTHLGAIIRKQRKTHKGWTLKEPVFACDANTVILYIEGNRRSA